MGHYFLNQDLKSNEKKIKVKIKDTYLTFITDNGVFSKKGLDFGTRTLLENLSIKDENQKILDFGCGYGPIGIYIAKTTKNKVDMIDINLRSLKLADKNAKLNDVSVNIFESNIYEKVKEKYDIIISNPPIRVGAKILYKILFEAKEHLKNKGELWIVVNKNQGAKTVYKNLSQKYKTSIIAKNKGFYIICAVND